MPERNTLRRWLVDGWYGGRRRPLLVPLAWLFAAFTVLRRLAYRSGILAMQHPGVPVVVVGNLAAGGTGKTPLVLWLVRQLAAQGIAAGIVLRGHGGSASGPLLVVAGSDPREVGDEAVLLAQRAGCPVAVGRQRVAAARLLVEQGVKLVLSDDGLQHLALRRDLEIVVVDGARGFGNGALLPQGPLREKPGRLRSVDALVINGPDAMHLSQLAAAPLSMHLAPDGLRRLATGEPVPLQSLQGAAVHAVAGIGNPQRFFSLLRSLGCRPLEHAFDDHHAFKPAELAFVEPLPIVMTEKDAVKCRAFATDRMQYLQVSAQLPGPDAARLLQQVLDCLGKGERKHA